MERPSPAVQDYLKAIHRLGESADHEGPVTTTQVAEALGVTTASASNMLKKLDGLGLRDPGQAPGRGAHRAGPPGGARGHPPPPPARDLSWPRAWACRGTRSTARPRCWSTTSRRRSPTASRRRSAIPSATRTATPSPPAPGSVTTVPARRLSELADGSEAVVGRVDDQRRRAAAVPRRARPGARRDRVEVLEHAPFGGPISVRVGDAAWSRCRRPPRRPCTSKPAAIPRRRRRVRDWRPPPRAASQRTRPRRALVTRKPLSP